MKEISLKIAAKTDVGRLRTNNEDNFQLAQDLTSPQMQWVNNTPFHLGEKGCLLVVADGMGGMNAGEVASQIAIDTVREFFSPANITDEVLKSRFSIEKYMKTAIQQADRNIKTKAKTNPENKGMGTTIVVAWIYDGFLYVSWVGDSRAYLYNPKHGLKQISKDHSYVQTLVDKGIITEYDAFDYPDSNVITRSLSDVGPNAEPDCLIKPIELCDEDIVLLCSDGLCGLIRDNVTESIIARNTIEQDVCIDTLIEAAMNAGGTDNCTVALANILSCGNIATLERAESLNKIKISDNVNYPDSKSKKSSKKKLIAASICAILALCGIWWGYAHFKGKPSEAKPVTVTDSLGNIKENDDSIVDENVDRKEAQNNESSSQGDKVHTSQDSKVPEFKLDIKFEKPEIKRPEVKKNDKNEKKEVEKKDNHDWNNTDKKGSEVSSQEPGTGIVVVEKGDNFTKISQATGVSVEKLKELNPDVDETKMQEGQRIRIH